MFKRTRKVNFRPSILNWVVDFSETYSVMDLPHVDVPVKTMKRIINHGEVAYVVALLKNPNVPVHLLKLAMTYRFGYDLEDVLFNILKHPNCTAEMVENIFEASLNWEDNRVVDAIASHPLTSTKILVQLLPYEGMFDYGSRVIPYYHISACNNLNTPVQEALYNLKWLNYPFVADQIWVKRVGELNAVLKSEGVIENDYPMEWLQELLWSGAVK